MGQSPTRPPRLRAGDMVGLVAPARAVADRETLAGAVSALEGWGLAVRVGHHIEDRYGYLAGRDEHRAADFNAMWADPEVRAVVCLGAGYGSGRLVSLLDRERIAANPKALCGYSDITALHLAIQAWSDTITFYSIGAGDLASPDTSSWSKTSLHRSLFSSEPYGDVGRVDGVEPRTIVDGSATGRLTGGCLPVLTATIGSPIEVVTADRILILEDVHERPAQDIDRGLIHLRDAGLLERVAGVVVSDLVGQPAGSFTDYDVDDVLREVFAPLGVPVLAGLAIGHGDHHGTVPLGATATLDAGAGRLVVHEVVTADP